MEKIKIKRPTLQGKPKMSFSPKTGFSRGLFKKKKKNLNRLKKINSTIQNFFPQKNKNKNPPARHRFKTHLQRGKKLTE